MGKKRRSKTSKQKQAKTVAASTRHNKHRQSQFGGVALRKGRPRQDLAGRNNANTANNGSSVRMGNQDKTRKKFSEKRSCSSSLQSRQMSYPSSLLLNDDNGEHTDFDRAMASQQERHFAAAATNKKHHSKSSPIRLQSARLVVDDRHKSTMRLVEEAAQCVQRSFGMEEARTMDSLTPVKNNSLQVLAARHREAWSDSRSSDRPDNNDNFYAALHTHSDSEDTEEPDPEPKPLFQLTPASFAIAGANSRNHADSESVPQISSKNPIQGDEIDPDL